MFPGKEWWPERVVLIDRVTLRSLVPGNRCRNRSDSPAVARSASEVELDSRGKGSWMKSYYRPEDLPRFEAMSEYAKELGDRFFAYYGKVFEDGALTAREKSLIALAVAHAVQCPYCIDAYTRDSLEKGSDLEQMTEAVHVAAAIRGGASLIHGLQMRNVADELGM